MDELKRMIIRQQETDDDEQVGSVGLRPQTLQDFVGQRDVVEGLRVAIQAAQQRGDHLEHTLFSGPPGLGKTSLANIIAQELKTNIVVTSGPAIDRAGDFVGILTNLSAGDVLFIDEIHRLSKVVEEFLYPAMESFHIDFVVDKGPYAKTINFNLKPFTLIGATTRSGLLQRPLRDRFGLFYHLEFYAEVELAEIIQRSARKLDVEMDEAAALFIAHCSRGTPRIANRLLRRVRDFAQVKTQRTTVTEAIAREAIFALGVDGAGLDEMDRRVLTLIRDTYKGGPVGIRTLGSTLNEEPDTLEDVVEPFLLKQGFLRRTPRGRELTPKAYEHLGLNQAQQDLYS